MKIEIIYDSEEFRSPMSVTITILKVSATWLDYVGHSQNMLSVECPPSQGVSKSTQKESLVVKLQRPACCVSNIHLQAKY